MFHVLLKNTALPDQQSFEELLAEIPANLHPDIYRHRRHERRRAALWARRLLCKYMEQNGFPLSLLSAWHTDHNGKPHCAGIPHFSFSHSGAWVGVAISDTAIGFDIQEMRNIPAADFFADFMHPAEWEWLQAQKDQNQAFITLWAKKEALLKLLGTGMAQSLRHFSVVGNQCQTAEGQQFFFAPVLQQPDVLAFVCTDVCDSLDGEIALLDF